MVTDYIVNVKGGIITKEVDNNWKLTGVSYNEELRNVVVELINDGTLKTTIKDDVMIESLTYDNVISQLRELGLDEKVEELENIKNGGNSSDNEEETPEVPETPGKPDKNNGFIGEMIVIDKGQTVINKVT